MDIKTVSHMLGHTDAGFTMNTYMHVTDSMQENVANTMGNLLGGNAAKSHSVKKSEIFCSNLIPFHNNQHQ